MNATEAQILADKHRNKEAGYALPRGWYIDEIRKAAKKGHYSVQAPQSSEIVAAHLTEMGYLVAYGSNDDGDYWYINWSPKEKK